jgi:hypothetical protein
MSDLSLRTGINQHVWEEMRTGLYIHVKSGVGDEHSHDSRDTTETLGHSTDLLKIQMD